MTTKVTIKNENVPPSRWDVEIVSYDGTIEKTLAPGESSDFYLWHDGRALTVREKPTS